VEARIRSFGYDSAFMLTSSISDLDLCAQDLIARLRGFRSKPEERKAPIIFIAHSLGGLLVKQVRHHNLFFYVGCCFRLLLPFREPGLKAR